MNPDRITAPHLIPPLRWTAWNDGPKDSTSTLTPTETDVPVSISSLLWNDAEDPLSLKSQPFVLQDDTNVRLDLPPPTHLQEVSNNGTKSFKVFRLNDFLITPEECWDDAELSSRDPVTGKQLSLTSEQRKTLRLQGRINVPSRRFVSSKNTNKTPQYHTWQVARGLYSGTLTVLNDFLISGFGTALDHMFYSGDGIVLLLGGLRTILSAFYKVAEGCTQLIRTYPQPKYSPEAIEVLLDEAKDRYVYSQFNTASEYDVTSSGGWMLPLQKKSNFYYQDSREYGGDLWDENYIHSMWKALQVDGEWAIGLEPSLGQDEWNAAKQAIQSMPKLCGRTTLGNDRVNVNDDAVARTSTRAAQRFFEKQNQLSKTNQLEHLMNAVNSDPMLYSQYKAERIRAEEIEMLLRQDDDDAIKGEAEIIMKEKCKRSPMMSLSPEWKRRQLNKIRIECSNKKEGTFDHRLSERLKEFKLDRRAKIRIHTNEFNEKHRSNLEQALRIKRIPLAPAIFQVRQLNPKNWTHKRHLDVEVPIEKPWWRLRYLFVSFWSTTKDVIGGSYHFLLHGPLSFRALLSRQPYRSSNATERHDITQTLLSRLDHFWSALSDVRSNFEAEPDSGLIGKSIARLFLRMYLSLKGLIGTTWIIAFMTVGTALSSLISASFLMGSPILGVMWALCEIVLNVFIFDFPLLAALLRPSNLQGFGKYHPRWDRNHTQIWDRNDTQIALSPVTKIFIVAPFLVLKGAVTSTFAIASSFVIHPFLAIIRITWAAFRFGLRSLRDLLTWPVLIAAARAPATGKDTWLAYRIHGPGIASEKYFRLPLWSAKLAVRFKLDLVRLNLHQQLRSQEFMAPYNAYIKVFNDLDRLGIKATPITDSPLSRACEVSNGIFASKVRYLMPRSTEHIPAVMEPQDVWEQCSYKLALKRKIDTKTTGIPRWHPLPIEKVDAMILKDIEKYNKVVSSSPLQSIVDSIVPTYATWLSQKRYRDFLLCEAVSLPMDVSGSSLRLNSQELDELWTFTLSQVDLYGTIIRTELEHIADESDWLLKEHGEEIAHLYNDRNDSNAIIAYKLLCNLFGETAMTETLEEIDETLVLDAGIAPEDCHLMIWMDESDVGLLLPKHIDDSV